MNFAFVYSSEFDSRLVDPNTFRVKKIWQRIDGEHLDISHLIGCTYGYHSVRELRWHLADRFAIPVRSVSLSQA